MVFYLSGPINWEVKVGNALQSVNGFSAVFLPPVKPIALPRSKIQSPGPQTLIAYFDPNCAVIATNVGAAPPL